MSRRDLGSPRSSRGALLALLAGAPCARVLRPSLGAFGRSGVPPSPATPVERTAVPLGLDLPPGLVAGASCAAFRRRGRRWREPAGPASTSSPSVPASSSARQRAPSAGPSSPASGGASPEPAGSGGESPEPAGSRRARRLGTGGEPGRVSPILGLRTWPVARSSTTAGPWGPTGVVPAGKAEFEAGGAGSSAPLSAATGVGAASGAALSSSRPGAPPAGVPATLLALLASSAGAETELLRPAPSPAGPPSPPPRRPRPPRDPRRRRRPLVRAAPSSPPASSPGPEAPPLPALSPPALPEDPESPRLAAPPAPNGVVVSAAPPAAPASPSSRSDIEIFPSKKARRTACSLPVAAMTRAHGPGGRIPAPTAHRRQLS